MSTAFVISAIVLSFRSDGIRSIFYDPINGVSMEAVILSFFLAVIVREVASEINDKDATTTTPKKVVNSVSVKVEQEALPKKEKTKPAPVKEVSIEDMKAHAVVRIPEGLKKIEKKAFYGNKALTWIEISSTVTEIEEQAFCNCTELKSVTFKEGCLEKIGNSAFKGCSSLTSIKLPSKLKEVDELAFCDCIELTSVDIQPGLKTMGHTTFRNCAKLTAIEIPSGCSLQFSSD